MFTDMSIGKLRTFKRSTSRIFRSFETISMTFPSFPSISNHLDRESLLVLHEGAHITSPSRFRSLRTDVVLGLPDLGCHYFGYGFYISLVI